MEPGDSPHVVVLVRHGEALSGDAGLLRARFGDGGCLVATRIEGGWRLDALVNHDLRP